MIAIYVDNIFIINNNSKLRENFLHNMAQVFKTTIVEQAKVTWNENIIHVQFNLN
jgi:hypothetical protein